MNFFDILFAEKHGEALSISHFDALFTKYIAPSAEIWGEYDGPLPAQYTADGSALADYRIYGAAGGVGDDSGTAYGYSLLLSVRSENLFDPSDTVPNYRYDDNGNWIQDNGVLSSGLMKVTAGKTYKYKFKTVAGKNAGICRVNYLNASGQWLSVNKVSFIAAVGGVVTISGTAPAGTALIRTSQYNGELDISMIEEADTPIYIGSDPLGEDEYADYKAGKIYRTTKNIMPSAAAGSATDHGVTVTCDGNSTYQISGRANGNAVIRFDLREFTIPAALDNGGNGVIALSYPRDPNVTIYLLDGNNAVYTINPYYGNVYTDYGVGLAIDGIAFAIADGQYADEFPFIIMITNDGTVPSVIADYVPHLTPTDPPVALPALPTCDGTTITDYAGQATAETETNNIMPSAAAETKTVGNTTVTCDGHGRYHITKPGSGDNYVSFDVPEFTIPISVAGGGNGTVSFFNTMSDKAAVAFYNGSTKIDSWNMNSTNRQTNSYGTMAGQVCDKIEINAWGSSTWTGDINIMFTDDGVLPTAFVPHIVETAKPRPSRFYAKYRRGDNE